MARELDLQTKIINSARKDGGYGRKMSNRYSIGIPDLLLGLFPFAPCLAEVKDLGAVVTDFDRKLDITPKQYLEMDRLSGSYEGRQNIYSPDRHTALVLVGIIHRGSHRLVACSRQAERLDAGYEGEAGRWVERAVGGYYDLRPLLEWAGICKVRLM